MMNNKEWTKELSNRLSWEHPKVLQTIETMVELISEKLAHNKEIPFLDLGVFRTEKKAETVYLNIETQQRFLNPPAIIVSFITPDIDGFHMPSSEKENHTTPNYLADLLASVSKFSSEDAQNFLVELQSVVTHTLQNQNSVDITGLGTFQQTPNQHAEQNIIVFFPDQKLRDLVNKPFAHFEPVLLHDEFDTHGIEKTNEEYSTIVETNEQENRESNLETVIENAAQQLPDDNSAEERIVPKEQTIASVSDNGKRKNQGVLYIIGGGLLLAASALLHSKK